MGAYEAVASSAALIVSTRWDAEIKPGNFDSIPMILRVSLSSFYSNARGDSHLSTRYAYTHPAHDFVYTTIIVYSSSMLRSFLVTLKALVLIDELCRM